MTAVLASGGKLPVLVLRRDDDDAVLVCEHLQQSNRLDVEVVRPADLVRTPLRWPQDQRIVPLALCVLFRDRPRAGAAAEQLVAHVGDIPIVAVIDAPYPGERTAEMASELIAAGVTDVVDIDHLNAHVLEQIVVSAIDRSDQGVLQLNETMSLAERSPAAVDG
ncbi:MAG TPA: hypothetical protein PLS63_10160 [Microthrixaceae bacterium]|nr:hypothetical protein [Microthrixaceae bacterium]